MKKKDNKKVIYWLLTGCILIFIMVIVGGITRLTHSGLSISNYKLISGTIPPMNDAEWNAAFDLYKQYPEYQKMKINYHSILKSVNAVEERDLRSELLHAKYECEDKWLEMGL